MAKGQEGAAVDTAADIRGWCLGRLPDGWFTEPPEVTVDREEITVVGQLPPVAGESEGAGTAGEAKADALAAGRSRRFREQTREERIGIAREAERKFGRKVSWGVVSEGRKVMFTTLSVPVMTRLRQPERRVLDTLVDAGWPAAGATRWPGACAWWGNTRTPGSARCATHCSRSSRFAPRGPGRDQR